MAMFGQTTVTNQRPINESQQNANGMPNILVNINGCCDKVKEFVR